MSRDRRPASPWPKVLLALLLAGALGPALSEPTPGDPAPQRPLRQDARVEIETSPGSTPVQVAVEVADDPQEHSAGLMNRRLASDAEGMLFVFPQAARRAFWMHNTPGSLDLLFVGADLRLVALIPRAEPMSDRVLSPRAPAQYVIEVPGGFAERHGIGPGARIRILPEPIPAP